MKSKISLLFLCMLASFLNGQNQTSFFKNKKFISLIETVCEETPDENPCAGYEVFLEVTFKEDDVFIVEKSISSCKQEEIYRTLNYKWKLIDNTLVIAYDSKEIAYSYLKDIDLQIKKNKLYGYKKRMGAKQIEYKFEELD